MTCVKQIAAATLICAAAGTTGADVVLEWNHVVQDVMIANVPYQNPGMASRTAAMMNVAMYDAMNAISPRHQLFYEHDPAPDGASAEAAAAQAAYRVLISIYPEQVAILDAALNGMLDEMPDGPDKVAGMAFGDLVGADVVAARINDGFDTVVQYTPTLAPGHWQPDPLNPGQEAWGPGWGDVVPFALTATSQITVPPPPAINTPEYAAAYNEVKDLGALNSPSRTADQTEMGLFWAYDRPGTGSPLCLYTQILRNIAIQSGNDMWENARLFAMAGVAMADASCVAWDSKFEYDYWRPVTAIRQGDLDDNPLTSPDPTWTPLGAPGGIHPDGSTINDFTPPFPAYLSGHATIGSALFGTLMRFYGGDSMTFQLTSDELPGVTRSFTSFSQALAENGRSRIYLGVHWNFDDLNARIVGLEIADVVADNHFGSVCTCELDAAEGVNIFDLLAYLNLWFAADAAADLDGVDGVQVLDLILYLDCWFPAASGAPCA